MTQKYWDPEYCQHEHIRLEGPAEICEDCGTKIMKAYTYSALEVGLSKLPPGTLRLGGFESTQDPKQADVFIVPCDIRHLTDAFIFSLPYLKGNEKRHALFCISDQPNRALGFPAISFRADCNQSLMQKDPSTISWPWPVKDLKEWAHPPKGGFQYDVCFVGWNSTPLTQIACGSVSAQSRLKSRIQLNSEFYGTWETKRETEKLEHFRSLFLESMHYSRLSLCARSIAVGVVRYRFYEALSMGRIPVHINDGAWLPFQNQIDWDRCSLAIPESRADQTGEILADWINLHSDEEILARGLYGREMWDRWLNGAKWDDLFGWCAKERLEGRL